MSWSNFERARCILNSAKDLGLPCWAGGKERACGACRDRGKIVIEYVYPPIPTNAFDFAATRDGYEPGDPLGYGPTPAAAIAELKAAEAEQD